MLSYRTKWSITIIILCLAFNLTGRGQSIDQTEKDSIRAEINERLDRHKLYYNNTVNMYGLARAYTSINKPDSAFYFLEMFIDSSNYDFAWTLYDESFVKLRKEQRWSKIQSMVSKRYNQLYPAIDTILAFELRNLYYERLMLDKAAEKLSASTGPDSAGVDSVYALAAIMDSVNLKKFETFIYNYGWPSKMLVGREGLFALFHILHFAPYPYHKKYYTLVQKSAEDGDVPYSYVAHLADAILKHEGKKQVYGTQVTLSDDGQRYELYPVEDELNLDKRREELGMSPIESYLNVYGIEYIPPKKN